MLALVLGGGSALGAYHGGVVSAMEAAGVEPDWLAGSSIGAVMAALVAGNPPGRRTAAVREFWRRSASPDGLASWVPDAWRKAVHLSSALETRLLGRPALYHLRAPEFSLIPQRPGVAEDPGVYDAAPMRRLLEELVDFDLLNAGPVRVSVMTVDLASGQEAPFDTARERLGVEHIMASAALTPAFPAVRIGGRAYVDGSLAANVPVDLVLQKAPAEPLACFTADPFPLAAPHPRSLGDAAERQPDLLFASQTERTLRAARRAWALHGGAAPAAVYRMNYASQPGETAMKVFDFSQSSLDRRWRQGERDMQDALRTWRDTPPHGNTLAIHDAAPAPRVAHA